MTVPSASAQRFVEIASDPLIERVGRTLVHSLWEIALAALLLIALLRLLRRSDPNARYMAACAAMALMAALPAVTFLTIDSVPSWKPPTYEPNSVQASAAMRADHLDETTADASSAAPVFSAVAREDAVVSLGADRDLLLQEGSSTSETATHFSFEQWLSPFLPWLVVTWAFGVLFFSLKTLTSWFLLRRLRRESERVLTGESISILKQIAFRLGVVRPVQLVRSSLVDVPTVFGWISPVIVLPASALYELCPSQVKALLAHELAHVRRHDYLVNIVQRALETLLFYHPAVWWVSSRIRSERELCCDDVAAAICGDRVQYAEALLRMEELRLSPNNLALAAGGGDLLARVRRLAGQAESSRSPGLWSAGIVSLVLVAVPLLTIHAAPKDGDQADPRVTQGDEAAPLDLVGTVIGKDQQPVGGATVFIYTAGVREGSDTLCPSCYPDCAKKTKTDNNGQFKIQSLDPKLIFRVLVASNGFEPTFATKVDPASGPLKVVLEPRASEGADPQLAELWHLWICSVRRPAKRLRHRRSC